MQFYAGRDRGGTAPTLCSSTRTKFQGTEDEDGIIPGETFHEWDEANIESSDTSVSNDALRNVQLSDTIDAEDKKELDSIGESMERQFSCTIACFNTVWTQVRLSVNCKSKKWFNW